MATARELSRRGQLFGTEPCAVRLYTVSGQHRLMSKVSEYLIQAEFCKEMAERTGLIEGKARWLELAGKWLALVDERLHADRAAMAHADEIGQAPTRTGTR